MKDYIFTKYNSIGEFSRTLKSAEIQPAFKSDVCSNGRDFHFYGTSSYDEADNLLLFGDKELQAKIEAAGVNQMRMKLKYEGLKRQLYTSVVGFAPNVPAFIAGAPNSMINQRKIKTRQPVITVMYNSSVSWDVSANEIIKATAQMIAAIMLIEASGIRVNLYVGGLTSCRGTEQKFGWLLRIKDSGQNLDTLKMAYPLAHPSMLRRHGFRSVETAQGVDGKYAANGYGRPIKEEKESQRFLKDCNVHNIQRVLCFSTVEGKTAEQIAKMITEEAKK